MIRLLIYVLLLGLGAWGGTKYTRVQMVDACLNAGGGWDARGFCSGAQAEKQP